MNTGSLSQHGAKPDQQPAGRLLAGLLIVALLARLVHLASAVDSPFSYHLGPDEDYYLGFGQWVAGIVSGDPAEFAFMDPAYGYILGLVFKVLGPNKFAVLFLQTLLDTLTTFCIFAIGRAFGRPRAGLFGALLYALTATAILYTATFLKATWVANAIALWVMFGMLALRSEKTWAWLLFGLFCGYCVALRGNLLLLAGAGLILMPWLYARQAGGHPEIRQRILLLVTGFLLPLLLLSARNHEISGTLSPLPNNGGTVLHQVYNSDNPGAESWYPSFAPYSHPTEILRGYAREAERLTGRSLSPSEVDSYWRETAITYIRNNLGSSAQNLARKALEFTAGTEVANNRSLVEERLFSPVIRWLPSPFTWLFAMGVPGLILLLRIDRRALLAIAPVLVVLLTFTVFFAEARFRFHAVPMLALGAGFFIDEVWSWIKQRRNGLLVTGVSVSIALAGISAWATMHVAKPVISWDSVLWGYIKMGDLKAAEKTALAMPGLNGTSAKWEEGLGFIAWSKQDHGAATAHYERAVTLNPGSHVAHYNLAMMLAASGDRDTALQHVRTAMQIAPLPEYQRLLNRLTGE